MMYEDVSTQYARFREISERGLFCLCFQIVSMLRAMSFAKEHGFLSYYLKDVLLER